MTEFYFHGFHAVCVAGSAEKALTALRQVLARVILAFGHWGGGLCRHLLGLVGGLDWRHVGCLHWHVFGHVFRHHLRHVFRHLLLGPFECHCRFALSLTGTPFRYRGLRAVCVAGSALCARGARGLVLARVILAFGHLLLGHLDGVDRVCEIVKHSLHLLTARGSHLFQHGLHFLSVGENVFASRFCVPSYADIRLLSVFAGLTVPRTTP